MEIYAVDKFCRNDLFKNLSNVESYSFQKLFQHFEACR